MHLTIVTKKKSYEFEKEQKKAYRRFGGRVNNVIIIIILKEIEIT